MEEPYFNLIDLVQNRCIWAVFCHNESSDFSQINIYPACQRVFLHRERKIELLALRVINNIQWSRDVLYSCVCRFILVFAKLLSQAFCVISKLGRSNAIPFVMTSPLSLAESFSRREHWVPMSPAKNPKWSCVSIYYSNSTHSLVLRVLILCALRWRFLQNRK